MGMVSLSLPTIPAVAEAFVNEKDPLLYVRWHERVYDQDDQGNDRWRPQRRELKLLGQDMKESLSSSSGSQEQERARRTQPKNNWVEDNGVKLYPTFEWASQGDLLLNTVRVDYQRQVAHVLWDQTLALKISRIGTTQTLINDIQDLDWVVDGVSFMKATIARLEQRRKEDVQGGRFTNDEGKHTYVKFRWEGDDLLIDNTNMCHCANKTPSIVIYTKLALKMGWLRKIDSGLVLGPNLQQDIIGDQIPNMTKNSDWNDLNDEHGKPVFWTVRSFLPDYLQLSMSCSWRFANLNVAFLSVVGEPTRSLHVYSDVAGSSIVGNRVTDLLREIKYKRKGRGTMYFEPLHIQYMSLRNEVVEIIQIQVAETFGTGGDLVKFGEGNTIVTLHFKKT